jgi:phosphotransferase system enzyme I (PtsI)
MVLGGDDTRIRDEADKSKRAALGTGEVRLQGVSICPGIAIGQIRIVDVEIPIPQDDVDSPRVAAEQERYSRAVQTALQRLPEHMANVHGSASSEAEAIFEVHQAILADESFHDKVRARIAAERKSAEYCLEQEAIGLISVFDGMKDPYFKARGEDIRDLAYNLLAVLSNRQDDPHRPISGEHVLLSRHLRPSHAALAHRSRAGGFASESRALSSHAAILLKGFAVPAVGSVPGLLDVSREGDKIIVDGTTGLVVVRPCARTEDAYQAQRRLADTSPAAEDVTPCFTQDGVEIVLKANIENPEQVKLMFAHGLDGIGLFRTEFAIPADGRVPSEDEQHGIYRRVFDKAAGRFVTVRTFDIGADKQLGLADRFEGPNPALGIRGIRRHVLDDDAELRTQLRAVLRAASRRSVGVMFPMVTTVSDVTRAVAILNEVVEQLRSQGVQSPQRLLRGAMIEVPAAAIAVQEILAEVDFISLGTNDLLQYFMAADRNNEEVLHYSDPTAPAFLWLLRYIIDQAAEVGRVDDVTVCGEIASDPRVLPHLLRLGYRSFSISPVTATAIRKVCANVRT